MRKIFLGILCTVMGLPSVWAACPYDHFLVGQNDGTLIMDEENSNVYRHWNADYGSHADPYAESYYEFMSMYGSGYVRAEPGFSVSTAYAMEGVSGIDYNIQVERVFATPGLEIYDSSFNAIWQYDGDIFCLSDYDNLHAHMRYVVQDNPDAHYEIQYRLIDTIGTYAPSEIFSLWFGSYIPGDANKDGMVDVGDLGILAGNYGMAKDAAWEMGDFNDDGAVDVGDLGILAGNYGYGTVSTVAVPEPASLLLILGSGLSWFRFKRFI